MTRTFSVTCDCRTVATSSRRTTLSETTTPMATIAQWIEGARPRTLPAAIAPVIVGTGAAAALGAANLGLALLALIVSVACRSA